MSRILTTNKIAEVPAGKLLVEIDYNYYERESKGGVILPNAAHEEAEADGDGFNLSEWIIRHGKVVRMGESDNESYDWVSDGEIKVGDVVYWSIVRYFDYPLIEVDKTYYLIVDYHDILVRVRNEELSPVNGFYLFTNEPLEDGWGAFVAVKHNPWYRLEQMGEEVKYEHYEFNYSGIWEVGMDCLLLVPPIKLEADTNRHLDKDYFVAQKRHILMSCWPDSNT